MRALACLVALMMAGCGQKAPAPTPAPQEAHSEPQEAPYKVGQELLLPPNVFAYTLYPDGRLADRAFLLMAPGERGGEEALAVEKMGTATVFPGSLLKILEVAPRHVGVLVEKDRDGNPVDVQGYLIRWDRLSTLR